MNPGKMRVFPVRMKDTIKMIPVLISGQSRLPRKFVSSLNDKNKKIPEDFPDY